MRGFFKGWPPTLIGYIAQGAFKYGFYQYFKKYYFDVVGAESAAKYKTLIDLSCWFFYLWGDCWYCTVSNGGCYSQSTDSNPSFAKGFSEGLPKILRTEGLSRYVFVFFLSFFFIFWPNINKLRKLGVCTLVLFSCVSWDSNMSSQQWHKHPTLGTQWQQINILLT